LAGSIPQILKSIEDFEPLEGNWLGLDSLLDELFQTGSASLGIDAMFRVFERFPTEDGAGVFWSILHGLESLSGYEVRLVESVRKSPAEFSLLMVNRLLNSGRDEIGPVRLLDLLERVAQDRNARPEIRQQAIDFLVRHRK
jgi:hypothetical protein